MKYPNNSLWAALDDDLLVVIDDKTSLLLSLIDCGTLSLASGRLVVSDPFAGLRKKDNLFVQVPKGHYRVIVTLADVSDKKDGSHMREAYATLLLDEGAAEVRRKIITPVKGRKSIPEEIGEDETYFGFFVDTGTASFVDAQSVGTFMPDEETWYKKLFENSRNDSWFKLMDNPDHIRAGLANIELPGAEQGENIILFHSGWGDGVYPVIGGYDGAGELVRVHIDFQLVTAQAGE